MHIRTPLISGACALVALSLAACGGGGGGGGDTGKADLQKVTEWYDAPANTQKKAEGPAIINATGGGYTREGIWTEYFPATDGSGMQWTKSFTNGTWDQTQAWTEYNPDGSWRVAKGD